MLCIPTDAEHRFRSSRRAASEAKAVAERMVLPEETVASWCWTASCASRPTVSDSVRPAAPRVWPERQAQAGQVATGVKVATEVDFVAAARQGIPDLRAHQAKQEALARVGKAGSIRNA